MQLLLRLARLVLRLPLSKSRVLAFADAQVDLPSGLFAGCFLGATEGTVIAAEPGTAAVAADMSDKVLQLVALLCDRPLI